VKDSGDPIVCFVPQSHHRAWLVSYADVVTILLTFFVCLLSMSRISQTRYDAMARSFGNTPQRSLADVQQELESVIVHANLEERVRTELTDEGLFVEFENSILFASGDARLSDEAVGVLRPIGERLAELLEARYHLVVEGYTDDVPIHNARFHSNWELSTSRAIYVMEQLVAAGFDQQRISVQGFADTRARARGVDVESADADVRAADRRVVLRVVELFEGT
jgi:chemotaxis protein MotB